MIRHVLLALIVAVACSTRASAQGSLDAESLYLGTYGGTICRESVGSGAPSGSNNCDRYIDYTNQILYLKQSGTWKQIALLTITAPNEVLASPDGSSGIPVMRALVANDIPSSLNATTFLGDVVFNTNAGTSSYVSQVSGWRITNGGSADFRYLFANEFRVLLFTAEQEAVLAGALRVSKSYSTVSQTFTCPTAGSTATLWVNDSKTFVNAAVFVSGDQILIHALSRTALGGFSVSDCVGAVTSYADGTGANDGQQSWTFTRNTSTAGGGMTGGTTVAVNQLAQDMGVSGNGYIEMVADDGANNVNAPYTQVVTWVTAPTSANLTARCRLGQLLGITSVSEYGLLCGNFGGNAYVRFSDQNAEIKGIPLSLLDSSTVTVKLDPSVPSLALGNPLPAVYGGTTVGVWMGKDSSVYKFRVGDPAGFRLAWDGAHMQLVTDTFTVDSTGPWINTVPGSYSSGSGYRFTTGWAGVSWEGMFAQEPSSTSRQLIIWNSTNQSSKVPEVFVEADGISTSALLHLTGGTASNSDAILSANTIEVIGNTALGPTAVTPSAIALTVSGTVASNWVGSFQQGSASGFGIYVAAGSTSSEPVQAWFQSNISTLLGVVYGNGDWQKNTNSTWTIISDQKTKKNIIPLTGALGRIRQVQLHEYDYNGLAGTVTDEHGVGVIAQEVQALFPRSVKTVTIPNPQGGPVQSALSFNSHELFMNGVAAIIELDKQVQQLQADVDALKKKSGGL